MSSTCARLSNWSCPLRGPISSRSAAHQKRNLAEYEGYYNDAPALKVGQVRVRVDPRYFRPTEVETLLGDLGKAKQQALLKQHGFDVAVGVER